MTSSFSTFSWYFLRKYKMKMLITIVLSSLSLYLAGNLSSDYLSSFTYYLSNDINKALYYGILFAIAWACSDIIDFMYRYLSSLIYPDLEKSVRISCYNFVQKSNYAYFRDHGAGLIENYIDCAAEGVREIWVDLCESIIPSLFFVIVTIIKFFLLDYTLAIVTVIWIILRSAFFFYLSQDLFKKSKKNFELAHIRTNAMTDLLNNMQLAKIFNLNDHFTEKVNNIHEKETSAFKKFIQNSAFVSFMTGINAAAFTGCIIYIIYLGIKSGNMHVSHAVLIMNLSSFLIYVIWDRSKKIVEMFENYGQAMQALTEMNKTMEDTPSGDKICTAFNIRFHNFSYGYGDRLLFNNFNLDIPYGTKVAIIGNSGSGKSTLLNVLAKIFTADRGQIFIDNIDICDLNSNYIKNNIGFITQSNAMINDTIEENIRLGKVNANQTEIQNAANKAECYFIDDFQKNVGPNGNKLSGGQMQRICIARAFIRDFKVLFADEPTSSLDKITSMAILNNIFESGKGKTIFWVDHSLISVHIVDIIIFFYDNQIFIGSHEFLLNNYEFYRNMFKE